MRPAASTRRTVDRSRFASKFEAADGPSSRTTALRPGLANRVSRWELNILSLVLFCLLSLSGQQLEAQEGATPPVAPTSPAAPATSRANPAAATPANVPSANSTILDSIPRRIRYLLNDQDQPVPVLVDANLTAFLEWLERKQTAPHTGEPQVSVSSVEISGQADEQFAHLDAVIRVEVGGSNQAILYPLGLGEAVILECQIEGPQTAVYEPKSAEQGYRWWLEGEGSYEFRLKLLVPVRRSAPWRRLQLSVPLAPVSSLQLNVAEASPVLKAPEDVLLETRVLEGNQTQVRAAGFGTRLDLQWQPTSPAADQRTTLDVNTTLLVRGSSSGYLVEATQYVKALQGVFREFTVQLPDRCDLLQVEGAEILRTRVDPSDPERVTVELQNSTSGTVVVKWSVRVPQRPTGRTILEGFGVDSARRQSGEIGLLAPDGARWTISETDDPKLERMNAGELRTAVGSGNIVRAYRFFDQPFQLPLELQKVEPFFDVRPTLVLYATSDELRFEGRYDVRTFRGQLTELAMFWPGWRSEGWKLESVEPAGNVVAGLNTDDTTETGRVVVGISDSSPTAFQLRIVARCPLPKNADSKISLPRLESPSTASARVAFLHAENIDAELLPTGETALRLLGDGSDSTADALGYPAGLKVREYRLETDERQVQIRVTPQPLKVSIGSRTRVEMLGRELAIRQSLLHRVEYERLSSFEFIVPSSLTQAIRIEYQGMELLPTWRDGQRPRERIALVELPQPALGLVELQAVWNQQLPDDFWPDKESAIGIPLIFSPTGPFSQNILEFQRPAWFDVSAADADWQLDHVDADLLRWSASPDVRQFDGQLSPTKGDEGSAFLVDRAAIQVIVDRAGLQSYIVQVRAAGAGTHFNVQLPEEAATPSFSWDNVPVNNAEIQEYPAGSRRYSIPFPVANEKEDGQLLTIEYQLQGESLTGFSSQLEAQTPRFPQCRWTTRVLWTLEFPSDQHVFSPPERISPLYQWERDGAFWRRRALLTHEHIQQWLAQSERFAAEEPLPREAEAYAFSQIGPLQPVRFRLLSSAATFLCGAGSALFLGFLVIKVPLLRSLVSMLTLLCVVMTSALWFLPQFELLLQPMLFGGLVAALLGLQEYWSRRRKAGTILTLAATPSELHAPGLDGSGTHSLLVRGQDSATIFREPLSEGSQRHSSMESHAG